MTTQGKNINPRVRPSMKCRDILIYGVKNLSEITGLKCFSV